MAGCKPYQPQPLLQSRNTKRSFYRIQASVTRTEQIFKEMEERYRDEMGAAHVGGAGGNTTYKNLLHLDAAWKSLRYKDVFGLPPLCVKETRERLPTTPGIDVVVAGGTLGIIIACALQARGLKTACVERGVIQGRDQEWNISRQELYEMVELKVLTQEQAEACIVSEFNPVRVKFGTITEIYTEDVLNLGIRPRTLVAYALENFKKKGGTIIESFALSNVYVHPNGVQIQGTTKGHAHEKVAFAGKLLLDCMGNQSPIVKQIRHGKKPDGVCLVVGTCASGFPEEANTTGDVICTIAPSEPPINAHKTDSTTIDTNDFTSTDTISMSLSNTKVHNAQMFWEAFPAGSGKTDRTTYMFTYMDASTHRPSMIQLMEHYWDAMPEYQGVSLDDLTIKRILFGLFPTYRDSPLKSHFDRVLGVGDASGIQSPLSFGGLAALCRHLSRLTNAVEDAIRFDCVDKHSLSLINSYNPSLSVAWMFQKAMSIDAHAQSYDRDFINRLLGANFVAMKQEGDTVLKPFLQDVIQAGPLAKTLLTQVRKDVFFIPVILYRVGLGPLLDWLLHFMGLLSFTALHQISEKWKLREVADGLPPRQRFMLRRALEQWEYGAGLDAKSLRRRSKSG